MDEWAPLSRVDIKRGPVKDTAKDSSHSHDLGIDGYERKLTRNQKRKHDEINHVQKVKEVLVLGDWCHVCPTLSSGGRGRGRFS